MSKYLIALFSLGGLFALNYLFFEGPDVKVNAPSTVEAGTSFNVEVSINKASVQGFAKFQQILPAGMTAEVIDPKGASFSFVGDKVKFIWMSLPADVEFTISYKLTVAADMSGSQSIPGKFSYLENNDRKSLEVPAYNVTIGSGGPAIADAGAIDSEASDATDNTTPENSGAGGASASQADTGTANDKGSGESAGGGAISCDRSITKISSGQYKVEISIKNNGLTGFAKSQDILPLGMRATEDNANGAVFSFVGQKAKFVWMGLPNESDLKISYIIETQAEIFNDIKGDFSYLVGEDTKKCNIKTIKVPEASTSDPVVITDPITTDPPTTTTDPDPVTTTDPITTSDPVTTTDPIAMTTPSCSDGIKNGNETGVDCGGNCGPCSPPKRSGGSAKEVKGLKYRVQICAGHKNISNVDSYFRNVYSFSAGGVVVDNHEGWIKYMIGSYGSYKPARDKRNSVTAGFDFPGPFVTAYNNGTRITVQEALNITKNKWYP